MFFHHNSVTFEFDVSDKMPKEPIVMYMRRVKEVDKLASLDAKLTRYI